MPRSHELIAQPFCEVKVSQVRVHVLTTGFSSPNSRAFLFPLIRYQHELRSCGIKWVLFGKITPALTDCDVLVIESKFYKFRWGHEEARTLEEIAIFRISGSRVIFFDIGDSSGWLQSQVLPFVDGYRKNQLLRDRERYLEPMYGNRPFTDYYFKNSGVEDSDSVWSRPVAEKSLLDKLGLSWNSGLADYSLYGPLKMSMYGLVPWSPLLQFPPIQACAGKDRRIDVSCRFGVEYVRESVAWQRNAVRKLMRPHIPTNKISRRQYFDELKDSKIVVSPFGWGEINYRDYEVFLNGALLLKPEMSHLETWPDLFRDGETVCTFNWDLEDLEDRLDYLLHNPSKRVEIAKLGQENYARYLGTEEGASAFCEHFKTIIDFKTFHS